jgi:hypothetical protein
MIHLVAAAAVVGRVMAAGPCVPLSESTAWEPYPNTLQGFQDAHIYTDNARRISTPVGYERVFFDSNATISSDTYMGYTELPLYNADVCANICNAAPSCNACKN